VIRNGKMQANEKPGLGIEIDEKVVEEYRVKAAK